MFRVVPYTLALLLICFSDKIRVAMHLYVFGFGIEDETLATALALLTVQKDGSSRVSQIMQQPYIP